MLLLIFAYLIYLIFKDNLTIKDKLTMFAFLVILIAFLSKNI